MSEDNLQPKQTAITEMAPMQQGEKKLIIPEEIDISRSLDYCSPTVQDRLISEELINSSNSKDEKRRKKKKKVDNSSY